MRYTKIVLRLSVALFASCGPSAPPPAEEVTTSWESGDDAVLEDDDADR